MHTISQWAKHHVTAARLFIVLIKVCLAIFAWFLGKNLSASGVNLSIAILYTSLFVFLISFILYPRRVNNTLSKRSFYLRQKSCDFLLGASTFVCFIVMTNNSSFIQRILPSAYASALPTSEREKPKTAAEILTSLQTRDKSTLTKKEKRILRQEFKVQLKEHIKAKISGNKQKQNESLYILLTIIAAVGLLYLLAALACHISCSGAEGLAIVVGIVGAAGIIWGAVALIRSLSRKKRLREKG